MENYLTSIIGILLTGSSSGLALELPAQYVAILLYSVLVVAVVIMVLYQGLITKLKENKYLNLGNVISGLTLFVASFMFFYGIIVTPNIFMILNGVSFLMIFATIYTKSGF